MTDSRRHVKPGLPPVSQKRISVTSVATLQQTLRSCCHRNSDPRAS